MLELTYPLDPAEAMKWMRTAKGESAIRRWQVLYLAAQGDVLRTHLGKSTKRVHAAWIAKQTGYSPSRVSQIVREFNRKGLEMFDAGLRKRPNAGHPGALNEDRKRELVTRLLETTEAVSLEEICAFVQKEFEVKISKSTARRYRKSFKDWKLLPPTEPKPQIVDVPTTPEKQTSRKKPITAKESDKCLQPDGKTPLQESESGTSSPLPEPKTLVESPTRADTKKRATKAVSEKERIRRQQPTLFEVLTDDQT